MPDCIGCWPGVSSYPTDKMKTEAVEVWRWQRLIEQRNGVVFGRDGKAIYKWLDY